MGRMEMAMLPDPQAMSPAADFSADPDAGSDAGERGYALLAVDHCQSGQTAHLIDPVAEEMPVAMVYDGVSHAVMLATPAALEDFAIGFSLSEGIVERPGDILDIAVVHGCAGIEVRLALTGARSMALRQRRRSLMGVSGCGLCGTESLAQLDRALPVLGGAGVFSLAAVQAAQSELLAHQRLHRLTGATHAAAWCDRAGGIRLVREDIGRHNALDKLIGALSVARVDLAAGFVMMTSRASHEIVAKAATVGIGLVAAVSAPTAMAVRTAAAAGVTLLAFARGDRVNVYCGAGRLASAGGEA